MASTGTLSVQLYSVRDQLAHDPTGTLEQLARLGFRHVEPFGLGSPERPLAERLASARSLRRTLDDLGLSVSAVHAAVPLTVDELAEECAVLGADLAFVPHPRLVPGFDDTTFADPGRLDAFAKALGTLAQDAAAHDLRVGYHNHWFEWPTLPDGTVGWDRFWSGVGDELLAEVDLYWAAAAGADPKSVLERLGDRVVSVHLKDGPAEPGAPQTPIGTGAVDVVGPLAETGAVRWHVAEIDTTDLDPYELLGTNANHLIRAGISNWS